MDVIQREVQNGALVHAPRLLVCTVRLNVKCSPFVFKTPSIICLFSRTSHIELSATDLRQSLKTF